MLQLMHGDALRRLDIGGTNEQAFRPCLPRPQHSRIDAQIRFHKGGMPAARLDAQLARKAARPCTASALFYLQRDRPEIRYPVSQRSIAPLDSERDQWPAISGLPICRPLPCRMPSAASCAEMSSLNRHPESPAVLRAETNRALHWRYQCLFAPLRDRNSRLVPLR